MFELSNFYDYCRQNGVTVIPYTGCPRPAATLRDKGKYAIFLDFSQITGARMLRGVCYHEMGHAATGALHKVSSPFDMVERSEYRANRWSAQRFLTPEAFAEAFREGYTEPYQLAEYFDLPEQEIRSALRYGRDARNIDFTKK